VVETAILVVEAAGGGVLELPRRLEALGFGVEQTGTPGDARRRAARARLLVAALGAHTPGCAALLNELRSLRPELPLLVAAAEAGVAEVVEAMRHGACDYLVAPVADEALAGAVARALAAGKAPAAESPDEHAAPGRVRPFITADPGVRALLQSARAVAATRATVLIQGESGTGKEVLAAYIHAHSATPAAPYLAVNCAALPESLAEAELFGYERGAFTGALGRRAGKFELAGEGTLVLDEISELPLTLQAKLLRVLQERAVDRLGGERPVAVNARVIAISNVDLKQAVAAGRFREDLFYRINVLPFRLPPLRERKCDVSLLTAHFLAVLGRRHGRGPMALDEATLARLADQPWRGNVRELENAVERAVLLAVDGRIDPRHLLADEPEATPVGGAGLQPGMSVRAVERLLIMQTLRAVNDNRAQAAEMLGISIRTLRNKLRAYREQPAGA